MRMGTLKSDLIVKIGFSAGPGQNGILRVEYTDGAQFDYKDVPYAIFKKLAILKHPGTWWLTVRENYKFKEV